MATAVSSKAPLKRVGHKGADLIAPGNTLASFDAAVAAGVAMIEFDVLPVDHHRPSSSELVLCHDYDHLDPASTPTLDEGLDHLAGAAFSAIELDVDLKLRGYELRVVEALRERGLVERSLISSHHRDSLDAIRAVEPRLRLGWSVPNVKRDYTASPLLVVPALALLQAAKLELPTRAARGIRSGRFDALMAHWRLVDRRLLRAVHAAGGELYVWTVDDAARIRRLERLGADAVITNDPRLFDTALAR
jgi:glycerophosphoryl diester phosphodiesterase